MSRWRPERVELRLGDALADSVATGDARVDLLLDEFSRAVDARQLSARALLRCLLTGDVVRYAVVPWRDDLARPAERQVLALQQFVETHGEAAQRWTICVEPARHGRTSLAAGVETAALDRLAAAALSRGLRLGSVQPALTAAFNGVRSQIDSDGFWFALVEPRWTTLLLVLADEPRHVKRVPRGAASMSALLDREWFTLGIDTPRCPVYMVHMGSAPSEKPVPPAMRAPAATSWVIVDLTPPADAEGALRAAA